MSSRDKILSAVKSNQPSRVPIAEINITVADDEDLKSKYLRILESIGGKGQIVDSCDEIQKILSADFDPSSRKIAVGRSWPGFAESFSAAIDPHQLENVEVAIIEAHFAVAENAAVWVTEDRMGFRALPFICQHLVVIIPEQHIVATMHDAYQFIGHREYNFATFIAGPSKTADIEQSLVLGAHGPISMRAFLLRQE
ncbi:LutC/YkgG family protein [Pollutibacter soli]|uniref:LutC/YkgG family protein n=1 Tax=Pollutibacter soli TaxID=3034157 RepID=UPI0030132629